MRVSSLRLVASSSATRIRSPGFFAMIFPLIRKWTGGGTVFFSTARPSPPPPFTYLRIVREPTMNYNAYNVVETTYETFALAVAAWCFCFAHRLRGRAAGSPDPASVEISGCHPVTVSAAAADLRSERRPAAAHDEHAG